jgi:hypothetical protein
MSYPINKQWRYRNRREGNHEFTNGLALYYEINGDPISDNYARDEIEAVELFDMWRRWWDNSYPGEKQVTIHWSVTTPEIEGTFEAAPFDVNDLGDENFLHWFTWPVAVDDGEPVNFLMLPVLDKQWNENRGDKGGFIQEATGWKPAALQSHVTVEALVKAVYPG